ncbi:MAG: redox-regulated ATPase YchF [bacterium]|jgi:hypothetical protein
MATTVGLLGRPGSGKNTLFSLMSGHRAEAIHLGAGVKPQRAVVMVPDSRLDALAAIYKPKKVTPVHFEVMNLPGFGPSDDRKLVASILANYRNCQAVALAVNLFADRKEEDAARETADFLEELMMIDLLQIEEILPALKKRAAGKEPDARAKFEKLSEIKSALDDGKPALNVLGSEEEHKLVREYGLITTRPFMIVGNIADSDVGRNAGPLSGLAANFGAAYFEIAAKLEEELALMLNEDERREFMDEFGVKEPGLNRFIRAVFELLGLKIFFTCGDSEVRAWTVGRDGTALDAAAEIHTDMARGFIKADIMKSSDLIEAGSPAPLRAAGKIKLVGRDHPVEDGDVILIRFNV